MDATFGGGDLISASLAIMLGGDDDAELHDKEVTLTTSDVTGSQTAIFEYDPQNEPVSGDPAGPWDGYSLFTIDLSGVKDDIEDLQQQVSDLEDELEDCHDCWEEVVAALQRYDPDYDPAEGECPSDKVDEVVDKVGDLEEQIEECDQCKADVIAKLQEYDPNFDPQTCIDIPPEIDKIVDEESGFKFPIGTDPTDPDLPPLIGLGTITDTDTDTQVSLYASVENYRDHSINNVALTDEIYARDFFEDGDTGAASPICNVNGIEYIIQTGVALFYNTNTRQQNGVQFKLDTWDKTTGTITLKYRLYYAYYDGSEWHGSWGGWDYTLSQIIRQLAGYGDTSHTYRANN